MLARNFLIARGLRLANRPHNTMYHSDLRSPRTAYKRHQPVHGHVHGLLLANSAWDRIGNIPWRTSITDGQLVVIDRYNFFFFTGSVRAYGTDNLLRSSNDLRGMMGDDTVFALAGDDWLDSHGSWGKDQLHGMRRRIDSTAASAPSRWTPSMAVTAPTAAATAGSNATAN